MPLAVKEAGFPWPEVATDWTVVRVVAIDRTDGAGEEKVLLGPPSVLAAVALVPALDPVVSLMAVSPVVDSVAGLELLLTAADEAWAGPS